MEIKFEDLKIGQHLWVLSRNKLLMVAKFDNEGYEVCGPWECGIGSWECEILKLVDVPEGYDKAEMYYGVN